MAALGLQDHLVGRSHECDWPESITGLPVCTKPRFDVSGTSRQIDERVQGLWQKALSVYDVDAGLLKQLRPDVVLTQTQCEICAVSLNDVQRALAEWTGTRPVLLSLKAEDLGGVWKDIQAVAGALGAPERGVVVVSRIKAKAAAIAEKAQGAAPKPTVACIEWIDPLMVSGNWMPELVEMAGGMNLFGRKGEHSPRLDFEELAAADPDLILVLPCGFGIPRSKAEMPALTSRPGWPGLRAVREGRVYILDGNQYFNRPGPRLLESLEILAEIFHPRAFGFGHKGSGWERYP